MNGIIIRDSENFDKAQTFKENHDNIDFVVINADPRKYNEIIMLCSEIKITNQDQTIFVMADCYDYDIQVLKLMGCHISISPNTFSDLEELKEQVAV